MKNPDYLSAVHKISFRPPDCREIIIHCANIELHTLRTPAFPKSAIRAKTKNKEQTKIDGRIRGKKNRATEIRIRVCQRRTVEVWESE